MYSENYQITAVDLGNNESEKKIDVLVNDHGDHFELKTVIGEEDFTAQADDLFSAFQQLRDKLLESGFGIKCNAARINALQSGMMTNQNVVYLVELGKRPGKADIYGFWDCCDMEEYVSTVDQEMFREAWMDSLRT